MHPFRLILVLAALVAGAPQVFASDELLPEALVRVPESVSSVFIAEVSAAKLHQFRRTGDGLVYAGSVYMSIGQAGAGKQRSGDKRTPIGIYFVTERLDTSRLHEKYGVTAFPLDYPNAWDRRENRDGDGIWVHGVDPDGGKRPVRDTDGCIALPNEELLRLVPEFQENVTPVVVTRDIAWSAATGNAVIRTELEALIETWANSQASGDQHAYLSSYHDDFQRWGMNKDEWAALAVQTAAPRAPESVQVSDLLLLRYPEEGEIYLSRFRLGPQKEAAALERIKRLYWRRDEQGALKIIAESDG